MSKPVYIVHFYAFVSKKRAQKEVQKLCKQAGVDITKSTIVFSARKPKGARIVGKSDLGELYLVSQQESQVSLGDLLSQALKE